MHLGYLEPNLLIDFRADLGFGGLAACDAGGHFIVTCCRNVVEFENDNISPWMIQSGSNDFAQMTLMSEPKREPS